MNRQDIKFFAGTLVSVLAMVAISGMLWVGF